MKRGSLIRLKRTEMGYTQGNLGDLVGLDKASISRYESGKVGYMDPRIAEQLGEIFGIDPELLLENADIPEDKLPQGVLELEKQAKAGKGRKRERAQFKRIDEYLREPDPEIPVYESVFGLNFENPEKSISVSGLNHDPSEYIALRATPFYFQSGYRRQILIFHKDTRIRSGEKQLLLGNGKAYFGRVKEKNGIVAIRTELKEPDDLILFDTNEDNVKVVGTYFGKQETRK